jgi:hypothetical protein
MVAPRGANAFPPFAATALALALSGCSTSSPLPLRRGPPPQALSSRVWVGHGVAFQWKEEAWKPVPAFDYDFVVLERRYADHREAIKEIHRRDPGYNGLAGRRDQSLWFTVRETKEPGGGNGLTVESSLGSGTGHEDERGGARFELASSQRGLFVPFDHVRITQQPIDPSGRVSESVELYARKKDREKPFLKIEEEARVYAPAP